jgi:hypothetical protein
VQLPVLARLTAVTDIVQRPPSLGTPRCAACADGQIPASMRRFGGQRVCPECWEGLARFERSWAYRSFRRASLLALFAAEVAVRQPGFGDLPTGHRTV